MGKLKIILMATVLMNLTTTYAWTAPINTKDTAGQKVSITKDRVLLYFWATWCPDCKSSLQSVLPKFPTQQLQILAVNTDASDSDAEEFRTANKVVIQSITDTDKKIRQEFKIFSVPMAVLLKKEKTEWVVLKKYTGNEIKQVPADLVEKK